MYVYNIHKCIIYKFNNIVVVFVYGMMIAMHHVPLCVRVKYITQTCWSIIVRIFCLTIF